MELEKISPIAIKVWNTASTIATIAWIFVSVGAYMGFSLFTELNRTIIILICCIPMMISIYYFIKRIKLTKILYESWYFSIGEDMVILKKGIVYRSTIYIPMSRVQHVNTRQGPILKKYNLRDIVINTAGGSHTIPCIQDEIAMKLQEIIVKRAERSREENGL